ncbi:MAG TPA: hypothetical protein VNZ47_12815 [Candidatus Dormibacteraeota bacterium]|nr:hypothetical protein [Candidatus Dormibacteraeota bacterium]
MVFGMSLATFTLIHVIISLVGIGSGLIVLFGMFGGRRLDGMTALFLVTTVLTIVTGYGFPVEHLLPSHIVGAISLVVLVIAIVARYTFHLANKWRAIYAVTAVMALYLNCFVLVVQSFLKVPALHALAPKGNEPPFAIAQGILLVLFIVAGILAVKKFHPEASVSTAARAASGVKS